MPDKIMPSDIMRSLDKTIDTMMTYYELNDQRTSAYARVVGHLTGVVLDLAWDLPQEKRQQLFDKFETETQDYLHKLTLESLRAKETA